MAIPTLAAHKGMVDESNVPIKLIDQTTRPDVLIVEDDPDTADAMQKILLNSGYQCRVANTVKKAHRMLDDSLPDIALVDLGMPDGDGLGVIEAMRKSGLPSIIVVSGADDPHSTLACLRAGVVDYLQKPVSANDLKVSLHRAGQSKRTRSVQMLTEPYRITPGFGSLFGQSEISKKLGNDIKQVSLLNPCRAIISGEAGVLKPEIAALVHETRHDDAPIVYVNCAAETDAHAGLRFFGVHSDKNDPRLLKEIATREGYLARAAGGTLVLDDITSLPKHLQSSLTRFADTCEYLPIGALEADRIDCAVLGILREPVETAKAAGRLASEFYYALAKFDITVPPLRERKSDIGGFTDRAVVELNRIFNGEKGVSALLRKQICAYDWPGNLVEFKNVLLAAYLATEEGEEMEMDSRLMPRLEQNFDSGYISLVGNTFWEVEKRLMTATLDSVGGNKQKTARLLGISLKTLYNRLNAYK